MSTRIEKQQLAVFKAIDETIALYQQGITECHDRWLLVIATIILLHR